MKESTNGSEETPLLSEQVGASTGDGGNSLPGTTANNTYLFGSIMDTAESSENPVHERLKPAHSDDKEDGKMPAPTLPQHIALEECHPDDGGAKNEIYDGNSPLASDPTSEAECQTSAKRKWLPPIFVTVLALFIWIASKGGVADLITVLWWGTAVMMFWTIENTNETVHRNLADLHEIENHLRNINGYEKGHQQDHEDARSPTA